MLSYLKMIFFLSMTVVASTCLLRGQVPDTIWTRVHGGRNDDLGFSVAPTSDGGFIITGKTMPVFGRFWDTYLLKTDASGDTLWLKTYGSEYDELGASVQQTTDGGYILAGSTQPFGLGYVKVYLVKTDATGDTLWTKTLGETENDAAYAVRQTADNGYAITGYSFSWVTGGPDVFLMRTDSQGDVMWAKTYGGLYDDMGYSLEQTTDGGYVIAGFKGEPLEHDVFILRTDSKGDTIWTKTYGGRYDDVASSIQQTRDGGYIAVGHTTSFTVDQNPDVYLIRMDSKGDTLWTRTYGDIYNDVGYAVRQLPDNGYIIVGYTGREFVPGLRVDFDVYLIRTDENGNVLWTKTYGGDEMDIGVDVRMTIDGGYIVVGQTNSFGAGATDVYLLRLHIR
jgi:hypothetical protein